MRRRTAETDATSSGGGTATDLDGVPVPLAPGAEGVAISEAGAARIVQYVVPLSKQEATIAFYQDWTDGQPENYQRTEGGSGGVSWQTAGGAGSEPVIVAVLSPLDGDDIVTVTLTVGTFE